jgi:hypothetical protein
MRELFRTPKEECPACHSAKVHNVARIDPRWANSPRPSRRRMNWALRRLRRELIKGPMRARWAGLLAS